MIVGKKFLQAKVEYPIIESKEEEKEEKEFVEELKENPESEIEEYIFLQSDDSTLLTELDLKDKETIHVILQITNS